MKIAVFASGTGTTLQALMDNQVRYDYHVSLVVVNRVCQARDRAEDTGISTLLSKDWMQIDQVLAEHQIQMIVLAGFLAIIPQWFCEKWDNKIINIHPSLLPKFGGKGMYGMHVHQAVVSAGEQQSGCTVHYVSAEVDGGSIIAQSVVPVMQDDTPDSLAQRVQQAEKNLLPQVIGDLCLLLNS
jgi:phosphoribosylglycinamide formyltransferase-1